MQEKLKIFFLLGASGLAFLYLLFVLYHLQILEHSEYLTKRDNQNLLFNQNGKRGTIYATRKDGELVPLAIDEVWHKVIVSPRDIPKSYDERLYEVLQQVLNISTTSTSTVVGEKQMIGKEQFLKRLSNKSDTYEEVAFVDKALAEKVEELDTFGVYTNKDHKRIYPEMQIAAKLVGFVGDGDGGVQGKYGLEKFYESDLSGKGGNRQSFFSQIFSGSGSNSEDVSQEIVTSIEPNVSKFLYNLLGEMKTEWAADTVAAIVMKVDTGEIVAMEALPSFDPNRYGEFKIENFSNPSVNGVYELGSIMKPITMSAGINEKLVTPTTVYRDYGFVKVDEYTIKNFDERVRGDQTMQDVISNSLNTGAVYVQQKLGMDKFKKYFDNFGLKDNTEIDFPNEAVNMVSNLDGHIKVNYATAAFGQGVAVTPISMLTALNVIANEGMRVCPHFLRYKLYSYSTKLNFSCGLDELGDEAKQVISKETADTTKQMMIELIETGLAKGRYKDKNYYVGAKTGTAQLASPDGKYYKDRFIHSYYMFLPGDKPQYSVLIYQVNPKQGTLASLTLAPFASKIKDFLLDYYNIPPDR
jgi:cell division protein FtsI/penicillin-binding protein 2